MNLDQVLEESLGSDITKGIATAALILLTSFGIQKQNDNIKVAKEFLDQHPTYIEKLEELKGLDRFDKVTRNKVTNQWKAFINSQNLDPRLSRGLKVTGEGEMTSYKSGDMR